MKTLFIKITNRVKNMVIFPFFLLIPSIVFCWVGKPNIFYNQLEGKIDRVNKADRINSGWRGGKGVSSSAYEFTISNTTLETSALQQLQGCDVNNLVGKQAVVRYQNFLGQTYPNIVILTVNGKETITNNTPLTLWLLSIFGIFISASWLLWHFIRYWKSV